MVVNDPAFKHIESEITHYHDTLEEIQNLIESPELSVRLTRGHLIKRLDHLEQVTGFIKAAYERGNDIHKKIIELYYWGSCKNWNDLAVQMNVSRKEILKHRDEIIFAIAHRLGWR